MTRVDGGVSTFLALWLPPEFGRSLIRWTESARRRGLVVPGDHHLTLVYLGLLSEEERSRVVMRLAGFRYPAFTLLLERWGNFRHGAVSWVAPEVVPPALRLLHEILKASLFPRAGVGSRDDSRPFLPHVTVARGHPGAPHGRLDRPLSWRVESLVLAARLPEQGRAYRVLMSWPLGAGPATGAA